MPKPRRKTTSARQTHTAAPPPPQKRAEGTAPVSAALAPQPVALEPWAVEATARPAITLRALAQAVTFEAALYVLIFAGALLVRFGNLGLRPLATHEAATALGAWQFLQGQGGGVTASPFLFAADLKTFFLVGASDLSARIVPALLGSLLVLLPILLRRELGRAGAVVTAALLMLAPTLVYFARDVNGAEVGVAAGLAAAAWLWRYAQAKTARDLYLCAGAAAIAFTSSSVAFTLLLAGLVGAGVLRLLFRLQVREAAEAAAVEDDGLTPSTLPAVDIAAGAAADARRVWLNAALLFGAVYVASATAFLMNRAGLGAAFNLFGEWLALFQKVGPFNAPLNLLLVYEPLALVFGFAGLLLASSLRGDDLRARGILILFAVTALVATVFYSLAGNKNPAHVVVISAPLILLAGWFIGNLCERAHSDIENNGGWRTLWWGELPILLMALVLASLLYLQVATFFQKSGFSPGIDALYKFFAPGATAGLTGAVMVLGVLTVLMVLVVALLSVAAVGGARAANLGAVVVIMLLACGTVRALWLANFADADTLHELLAREQTSLQARDLARDLEWVSQWRANDAHVIRLRVEPDLGPVVDWYLRDFVNQEKGRPPAGDVATQAFVGAENAEAPAGTWISSRYRVTMNWQAQNLGGADLWKWLLFRSGGVESWQKVRLWVPQPQ